ncbi:unnamed protein product, partial [Rotaria sp. Silwood2]
MSFTCALCCRTVKINRKNLITVVSIDVEEKIKQAYENIHSVFLSRRLLNKKVHRECYGKYHRRYIHGLKNKKTSTQVSIYLSNDRLPLVDSTNYQLQSSIVRSTSTEQHSHLNSLNETYIFVDSTDTSRLKTSFTASTNQQ